MKELITRLKLPMSDFWKRFQRLCIIMAIVIPSTGELAELLNYIPEGYIPVWIKSIVGTLITLGILIPKFTVASKEELKKELEK